VVERRIISCPRKLSKHAKVRVKKGKKAPKGGGEGGSGHKIHRPKESKSPLEKARQGGVILRTERKEKVKNVGRRHVGKLSQTGYC